MNQFNNLYKQIINEEHYDFFEVHDGIGQSAEMAMDESGIVGNLSGLVNELPSHLHKPAIQAICELLADKIKSELNQEDED